VSSGDGMDTGPVLALEPLSTILPGNYRHLQHPQALDRPTPEVSVREAHIWNSHTSRYVYRGLLTHAHTLVGDVHRAS
jgi:hypothetical protein